MRAAAEIYSLRHLSQGQGVPADTPFCFFQGPLLLNGLKKSFVCPNGNQQDRITNDLVLAGTLAVMAPCWALCVEVDATAEEGPELPCGAESATRIR